MSVSELLALSLIVSVGISALAWLAGSLVERASSDPRLRDRVWGAGLLLSALPPLAVAVLLLAPAPVREVAAPAIVMAPAGVAPTVQALAVPASAALPDLAFLASLLLLAAVAMGLLRLVSLTVRIGRLTRLLRQAVPADTDLAGRVEAIGGRLEIQPPRTVVSATVSEALLSGLGRPCLILPQAPDGVASDAVIAHELAHLKRGDHRTLWLEEALVVLLAINPLIPLLRARRDAAREEACDALALAAAEPAARRAYAQTLIEALRTRAGPRGAGDIVALTFTGAGRTSAMHRLKAVMTPAAPAGRRTRLIAAALGLAVTAAAGGASVALAGQRDVEVRMIAAPEPDAPADGSASASRAAVQAALAALPPETRDRFRNTSAADYRAYCASTDAAEEGFCAGVMFSHLAGAPGNGLCVPEDRGDERARLTDIVARGKAEIARLAPRRDEGAYEYSERALKAAYPCSTEVAASPDGPTLTVRIGRSSEPFILGSRHVLHVTLQSEDGARGARNSTRLELPIVPDQPLEREVRFVLKDEQLPTLVRGQTYDLTAEIRDTDGRVLYAAEPVTVRMAPGSRERLAGMRPELVLARTAAVSSPAAAPRAYQARLTITENGQVVAAGRMRILPDDSAMTVLSADGREYQFDLSLEGPESDPESRGRLTARADVARTASGGGWETVARPILLMAPDGQTRMTWGDDAGLLFDIVVEPA